MLYGSDERRALQYLERELLLNIGMIEPIKRGTADLIYAEKEGVFLKEKKSGAYMISVNEPELAERLIAGITNGKIFVAHQQFCSQIIEKRYGLKNQFKCLQAAYLNKTLLPSDASLKIYILDNTHTQEVLEHYCTMDDPDYIKNLIDDRQIYGAFVNGKLAGFIGIHPEGSIGMLEVLPEFRRQGIGYTLECYIVNMMIQKGWTPFCQILENNLNSMALQRKLGLELSNQYLYWLF